MKLIKNTKPKMIIADEGKQIRAVNDIHREEYQDENNNLIPEHFPYYSTVIFVPGNFTEEQMNELYVEEDISTFDLETTEPVVEEVTENEQIEETLEEVTEEIVKEIVEGTDEVAEV